MSNETHATDSTTDTEGHPFVPPGSPAAERPLGSFDQVLSRPIHGRSHGAEGRWGSKMFGRRHRRTAVTHTDKPPTDELTTNINRTIGKVLLAATLAGLGFAAAPGITHAAGTWQFYDGDNNGYYDTAVIDANSNGYWEQAHIDSNRDGRYDAVMYNFDDNSTFEWTHIQGIGAQVWMYSEGNVRWYFIDGDGNGRYELIYYDGNNDGQTEYTMVDTNYDGAADTWRYTPVVAGPAPTTSVSTSTRANDMMVQHIVTMNQLRIYGSRL